MSNATRLYLTEEDYEVLESVVERYSNSIQLDFLENELARAEVVPYEEIPDNVVTLHSRARVVDESTGKEREITVVPPGDSANVADGKVSVLSPVGAAIIGLSEGQVIEWPMPSGSNRRFRVEKVLFQLEAARKLGRRGGSTARNRSSPRGKKGQLSLVKSFDPVEQASIESFPASDAPGWRL